MALFNEDAQNTQRQAVGVGEPQGLKQNRPNRNLFAPPSNGGINPGGGPYDPYGKPGGISGAQPPNPYGLTPHNGGINPGGMYTPPKQGYGPGGIYDVPKQYGQPSNGGINPGGMSGWGGVTGGIDPGGVYNHPPVWAGNNNPNAAPGSGGWVDPSLAARLGGGAMPPPTDIPPPRFPGHGNTGPVPPPHGPVRPPDDPGVYWGPSSTDPNGGGTIFGNSGIGLPGGAPPMPGPIGGPRGGNPGGGPGGPPPNPDPFPPYTPEGGPPPIEDPHGRFPMQPQGPPRGGLQNPWLQGRPPMQRPPQQRPQQDRPQQILPQESPIFPSRPAQQNSNGAMNAYLKSF